MPLSGMIKPLTLRDVEPLMTPRFDQIDGASSCWREFGRGAAVGLAPICDSIRALYLLRLAASCRVASEQPADFEGERSIGCHSSRLQFCHIKDC